VKVKNNIVVWAAQKVIGGALAVVLLLVGLPLMLAAMFLCVVVIGGVFMLIVVEAAVSGAMRWLRNEWGDVVRREKSSEVKGIAKEAFLYWIPPFSVTCSIYIVLWADKVTVTLAALFSFVFFFACLRAAQCEEKEIGNSKVKRALSFFVLFSPVTVLWAVIELALFLTAPETWGLQQEE